MSTSNLLVPIHLDALVVNNNDQLWKDISLDIDNLKNYGLYRGLGYYLEKDITIGGQKSTDNEVIPNGIHLHWTLPDSFRKGEYEKKTGALIFSPSPNRWLVVRIDDDQNTKLWVIESDQENTLPDAKCNWIKENAKNKNIEPVAIGNVLSFYEWEAADTIKDGDIRLTIMAPGNPDFAASYMHCKNVFGLHDDMTDAEGRRVAEGTLFTYQVFGWFNDAAQNPFKGVDTKDKLIEKLDELGWALDGVDAVTQSQVPDNILCHSMVNSVVWAPETRGTSKIPIVDGKVKIGVGNSSSEALASLLPGQVSTEQSGIPDKLLAAYQFKSLTEHGIEGDGLNLLKREVHSRGFMPVNGGTNWVIEVESKKSDDKEIKTTDKGFAAFDVDVSKQLLALNNLQLQYDNASNKLTTAQAGLYALKFKQLFSESSDSSLNSTEWEEVQGEIKKGITDTIAEIDDLRKELSQLKSSAKNIEEPLWPGNYTGTIVNAYHKLKDLVSQKQPGFSIKEVPMPKFYEPADPAVVITGLKPSAKYIDKDNTVNCRLKDSLANKIEIKDNNVRAEKIAPKQLIKSLNTSKLPVGIIDLIYESFLLDPLAASSIAKEIDGKYDDLLKEVLKVMKAFKKNKNCFRRVTGTNEIAAQVPQAYANELWEQPWNPLYLEWTAKWDSTYAKSDAKVLAGWAFCDKNNTVDFEYKPGVKSAAAVNTTYSGRTILSTLLANKIKSLNSIIKDRFKSTAELFNDLTPMSQTLSGLSSQLLMRYHGVQLPILDSDMNMDMIHQYIDDQNSWSPMITNRPFYPIRSGILKLNMVRVVDSFGQVMEVFNGGKPIFKNTKGTKLLYSSVGISKAQDDYSFLMKPRIIQPARLKFDWISAWDNKRLTDSDPHTSPVCGWFFYNKLDKNISVYNLGGYEIGILSKSGGKVEYTDPPGVISLLGTKTVVLNNVIESIKKSTKIYDALESQILAITEKIQSRESRQELTMTLPIGSPMAIVTAQFLIELKNPPATDQSWVGGSTFTDIDYTANIGNINDKMDGLCGCFLDNGTGDFMLPKPTEPLTIKCKTSQVQYLTLVMDPRAMVSISTGLLPIARQYLPQHAIAKALKIINIRFIAAPVITPFTLGGVKMPLLQNDDINWNFIRGKQKPINIIAEPGKAQLRFESIYATDGWVQLTERKEDDEQVKPEK